MDERTRTTEDELGPTLRRPLSDPVVKSRPFSKARFIIGVIVVIGLAIAGYEIVHTMKPAPTAGGRNQAGLQQSVGAATVGLGNIRVIVNALGTVTPIATVTVQTQIAGTLTKVGFTEGQMVQKGDFLAQIDARPYEILKAQYEGMLAHDQGLLAQAQMDLKRYQTLVQQNSIARQQSEDQVFIVQQYEGSVKQDQAQVDAQALNIAYCHIVSPVTGRIGLRLVDPGNYVQTSTTTGLAVVTQIQPITVVFSIPEDNLPQVVPKLNAGTKLEVAAFDRANVKQLAVGQVAALDNQIDTTTGTVKVRAQYDNADDALFPNQFVNVQLLVDTLQNVVTVPTAAIQLGASTNTTGTGTNSPATTSLSNPSSTASQASSSYVYAISANGTVSVRPIVIGPTDGTMTAVTSGLAAGDVVVVDGADRLRDGLHVSVSTLDGKPTTAAAPGAGGPGGRRAGAGNPATAPGAGNAATAPGAAAPPGTPGTEPPSRHGGQRNRSQNQPAPSGSQ
jgi:multidrug efflux system membrane fusion protein